MVRDAHPSTLQWQENLSCAKAEAFGVSKSWAKGAAVVHR